MTPKQQAVEAHRKIARAIADHLFMSGFNCEADRLVLSSKDGADLGGWCKRSVVNVIRSHLKRSAVREHRRKVVKKGRG